MFQRVGPTTKRTPHLDFGETIEAIKRGGIFIFEECPNRQSLCVIRRVRTRSF